MGKHSKKASNRITVMWDNGEMTTGATWREVEDNMRAAQWQTFPTREDFRTEMRHRAYQWGGEFPAFSTSSKEFINSLADLGMFLVVVDDFAGVT